MKNYILITVLVLFAVSSCKKDRHVSCQYDIIGSYSGTVTEYPFSYYVDSVSFDIVYYKGGAGISYNGEEPTVKFTIMDCKNGSLEFYQDSLSYIKTTYTDNPAENWSLIYTLTKD